MLLTVTVPKLVNFFRPLQKWGTTILHLCLFKARLHKLLHFRPEVGEAIRCCKTLPNLERSRHPLPSPSFTLSGGISAVSSPTNQGRSEGYWKNWLEDKTSENARFAYVASTRAKNLLVWAIPAKLDSRYFDFRKLGIQARNPLRAFILILVFRSKLFTPSSYRC